MIRYVSGIVIERSAQSVTVFVGETTGIGYRIATPLHVIEGVKLNAPIRLHTHHRVREDSVDLYGFTEEKELRLFELLIGVNGFGPKSALHALSVAGMDAIISAIVEKKSEVLQTVPGIGAKTAQRIVLDLEQKIRELFGIDGVSEGERVSNDLIDALVGLGYKKNDVQKAIREISFSSDDVSVQIREVLQKMSV